MKLFRFHPNLPCCHSISRMASESIKVFVRTRPTAYFANNHILLDERDNSVGVHIDKQPGQAINNQQEDWSFKFSGILHNASQEQVYKSVAKDLVEGVINGYSGTVIAYGVIHKIILFS
jgi:kinesin family protein 6/9